jgi:hypothetical protein
MIFAPMSQTVSKPKLKGAIFMGSLMARPVNLVKTRTQPWQGFPACGQAGETGYSGRW